MCKKANLEKKLWEEIKGLEDASYAMFEKGFDEAISQVKHFNNKSSINFSKVN